MALEIWPKIGLSGFIRATKRYLELDSQYRELTCEIDSVLIISR